MLRCLVWHEAPTAAVRYLLDIGCEADALDADAEKADWQAVAKIVLYVDPEREPDRAKRAWERHLARARWLTENGIRQLLRGGAPH